MIRVLVCDDQAVVRDGLEMSLNVDPLIEVVGLAENGAQALELAVKTKPDLILMDLKMPGMSGIQATQEIRKKFPEIKILVLTTFTDDAWVYDAVRSGADGYLLKDTPRAELIAAIKGTMAGESYINPAVGRKLLTLAAQAPDTQKSAKIEMELSQREIDVLKLIARGLNNAEIAERLYLSRGTIKNHVSSILSKLGVTDRTQAAILAVKSGIV